ncbi:hypothetical protein LOAG_06242 [Loa loa]|uniref:Uncharacterized protein n=1 Tax=Loa loa TaxID=7209 RepID=A0A1S0U030_LOALO|nr:hypothetical protein LOAG_06242 [Loa loa]EFO22242.1 hypothetical protein LOAG_06242 [Loa loa]
MKNTRNQWRTTPKYISHVNAIQQLFVAMNILSPRERNLRALLRLQAMLAIAYASVGLPCQIGVNGRARQSLSMGRMASLVFRQSSWEKGNSKSGQTKISYPCMAIYL